MKVVNRHGLRGKSEDAMAWIWNCLQLPVTTFSRVFRRKRRHRPAAKLNLAEMSAHWRRDLGLDN